MSEVEPATNGHKQLTRQEREQIELAAWCNRVRGVGDGWLRPLPVEPARALPVATRYGKEGDE